MPDLLFVLLTVGFFAAAAAVAVACARVVDAGGGPSGGPNDPGAAR